MKLMDLSSKFIGHWQGKYRLVLSWLPNPDFISVSSYDWQHEGVSQDGLILIGNNNNKEAGVTASWVDSWGMSGKIMNCYGTINQQGDIALRGSYEVPDNPDWGWRIEIPCPTDNTLQIIMYNLSPEGEEFLAGDANYARV
jgi:hypothetical protein